MAKFLFQLTDDELRSIIREEFSVRDIKPQNIKPPRQIKYITRHETSDLIRVSLVSLNKYRRLGILLPQKIGGRVLYDYDQVIQAIEEKKFG
jgi:hypothetical protein